MVIAVPVCDLRNKKVSHNLTPASKLFDDNQETQLRLGEHVLAKESNNGWLKVELLEQFNGNKLIEGYIQEYQAISVVAFEQPNIIVKSLWCPIYNLGKNNILSYVTIGTKFKALNIEDGFVQIKLPNEEIGLISIKDIKNLKQNKSEKELRDEVINIIKKFLGQPYLWGGHSSYTPNIDHQVTGVDCSSLVRIAYEQIGKNIPRNSGFQHLASNKIRFGKDLKPADLIFLFNIKIGKMTHVMIYMGNDTFIDICNISKENIARVEYGKPWFGKTFEEMYDGEIIESLANDKTHGRIYNIYFGTYFNKTF